MNTDIARAYPTYRRKMSSKEYKERLKSLCTENRKGVVRIIRDLKLECTKATPVSLKISWLMQRSFEFRYQEVYHNVLSVKNVMKHYPGLKFYKQLQEEFERVTRKSTITFEKGLQHHIKNHASWRVSNMNVSSGSTNGLYNEAINAIHQFNSSADRDKVTTMAAEMIVFLSDKFNGEWVSSLVNIEKTEKPPMKRKDIQSMQPFISVKGDILYAKCARVFCERVEILSDISFYDAVLVCYYLYYIFNLKYSSKDEQFFKLFNEILQYQDAIDRNFN